jgi:arginyl-tRNA synthetase
MIQDKLRDITLRSLKALGVPPDMVAVNFEHPTDPKFGDYSTNVAMLLAKQLGASVKTPFDLASKIAAGIEEEVKYSYNSVVAKVEAVGPGFINFYLTKEFFKESVAEAIDQTAWYGKGTKLWNKKILIEYTDPNPFKQFHIGHLMTNIIGESLARIFEFQDAKVSRANYQGDIGLHVAKAIWGMIQLKKKLPWEGSLSEKTEFLGKAYTLGSEKYEEDETAKKEIQDINKKIFDKSDEDIIMLYEWGRQASLDHFEELYAKLGTKFDFYFFESEMADEGLKVVRDYLARGLFKESDGAVIFPGEEYGLHNRVFITSQGLPTYETKELGLIRKKFEIESFSESITVTASEQNDYFDVIQKALSMIYPEIANRTKHVGHGMMRFASGKMSSRKGNIITGESLLHDMEVMVAEKIKGRDYTDAEKKEIIERVSIAAIKYSILKQTIGKDIVFDADRSLSFDGDSGPYLQYTYVRARSILEKAQSLGIKQNIEADSTDAELSLERLIYRFPHVVERSGREYAPHYIATYLIELAGAFNSYYAENKIVDEKDLASPYKIALTDAVKWTLKNGLFLLGIQVPTRM